MKRRGWGGEDVKVDESVEKERGWYQWETDQWSGKCQSCSERLRWFAAQLDVAVGKEGENRTLMERGRRR